MATQRIWLAGRDYYVERERSWRTAADSESWDYAHSRALVCPKCLSIWATLRFEQENYHPQGQYCEACGDGRLIPQFGPIDLPLIQALPLELARREFLLTLKHEEKEQT